MLEKLRPRHLIGVFVSILSAAALGLIPFGVYVNAPFDITPAESAPVAVFFVFVLGFLMNNAMKKGQDFKANVNLELSRMRRVFHLTRNLGTSQADKKFHDKVRKSLFEYFDHLNQHGLRAYKSSNKLFRKVSYTIYGYKPKTEKQKLVYKELLEGLREAATTRQNINSILHSSITSYGWLILLAMEVMVVVATLLSQGTDVKDFIVTAATLSTVFIVTLFVWEVDHYSPPQLREFGRLYGKSKKSLQEVR